MEDKSYRFIVELVSLMPSILEFLNLKNAPHFTTLQKAAARLKDSLVKRLVASFVKATKSLKIRVGIDATGLQPTRASAYYTKILAKDGKKRKKSFDWRRVECEKATLVLPRRALSHYIEVYWHGGKEERVPIKPITDREIIDEAERFRVEFTYAYSELIRDYVKGEFRNQGVLLPEVKKDLAMVFSAYKSAELGRKVKIGT